MEDVGVCACCHPQALNHPWLSAHSNLRSMPSPAPLSPQSVNQVCSHGWVVGCFSLEGSSQTMRSIPVELYYCRTSVSCYLNVSTKTPCCFLVVGQAVLCDLRLVHNGALWLHCVRNVLFDNDASRPEDSG